MKGFFICLFIYFIQSMKAGEEVRKKRQIKEEWKQQKQTLSVHFNFKMTNNVIINEESFNLNKLRMSQFIWKNHIKMDKIITVKNKSFGMSLIL